MKMDLKRTVGLDVKYGFTPDIASLRYAGTKGVKVFFWDDLKDFTVLNSLTTFTTMLSEHYNSEYYLANTVDSVRAYYNLKSPYAGMIFEEQEQVDTVLEEDYQKTDAHRLLGKLCTISLQLLTEIDCYYENGGLFQRRKIKVYPSPYNKTPMEAYTWFTTVGSISTNGILHDNIDLTPMNTEIKSGVEFFEM